MDDAGGVFEEFGGDFGVVYADPVGGGDPVGIHVSAYYAPKTRWLQCPSWRVRSNH